MFAERLAVFLDGPVSMLELDSEYLRNFAAHSAMSPDEIRAITHVAYLAAEIDFDEDVAEADALERIGSLLWTLRGLPPQRIPPVSPLPIDDEERLARIQELAVHLQTRGTRELAYVIAYLLIAADHAIMPVEGSFVDVLQHALGIDDDRAAELVATAAEHVTPGMH